MANDSKLYVPFSQRTGIDPIPPQLKLGEISIDLRRLLYLALYREIRRASRRGNSGPYFNDEWYELALDLHVRLFRQGAEKFSRRCFETEEAIRGIIYKQSIGPVFNLVEFIIRHHHCGSSAIRAVADAFVESRSAYRVIDKQIAGIGTEEQAAAFQRAVAEAEAKNASGARKHLIEGGVALRNGDWAGSVRESIHAVEAIAVRLAPGTDTLGDALKVIDKQGHLHGGLKAAFGSLYGYASDEKGVRHAKVFDQAEAQVDEADALFMLGACASFVSYLLARGGAA